MHDIFEKNGLIIERLKPYRWLLLPFIPTILFVFFLIYLLLQPASPPQQQSRITPTSIISVPILSPIPSTTQNTIENEGIENPETLSGFEGKQLRPDGTLLYIYTSDDPKRPSITITTADNSVIFSRTQSTKDRPIMTIPELRRTFEEPEKIIQGSTYYGSEAQIFFYGSLGVAFVVNPQTNETYEEHSFPSMNAEEYLQRYKSLN